MLRRDTHLSPKTRERGKNAMRTTSDKTYKPVRKRVASLKPSPENQQLYRPINEDPEVNALVCSIKERGLLEPLKITQDNFIVSGHRRRAALIRLGQAWVDCHVLPVRRDAMSTEEFIVLLREYNRQRHKTIAEQMREEIVDLSKAKNEAVRRLRERREQTRYMAERNGVHPLVIEGTKRRSRISGALADHVKYIKQVVFEDRKDYWPLSIRGVHYPLLNYDFLRNIPKELPYRNDKWSYHASSRLITRLRLNGEIPWDAFDDFTRPLEEFHPFANVRHFIRQEGEKVLDGYWRDYLQTQDCHVEVVCEKNTIYHMALRVTKKYQIWTSSGRGFNSIDPWHDLYQRFRNSRKKRLFVIVLSDFDPEGELIPLVGGRTLRDDFGLDEEEFKIIKSGVTRDQITKYNLPAQNFAKEKSKSFKWFVHRNGGDRTVWELEAMDPENMLNDLELDIRSVLDLDLFEREVQAEEEEIPHLEAARTIFLNALKGLVE
jgi:hypothetical protein